MGILKYANMRTARQAHAQTFACQPLKEGLCGKRKGARARTMQRRHQSAAMDRCPSFAQMSPLETPPLAHPANLGHHITTLNFRRDGVRCLKVAQMGMCMAEFLKTGRLGLLTVKYEGESQRERADFLFSQFENVGSVTNREADFVGPACAQKRHYRCRGRRSRAPAAAAAAAGRAYAAVHRDKRL